MQTYPSIDKIIRSGKFYVFDKLDGSNIRAEWTRRGGFVKFGSRQRLLDPNEKPLGEAVGLIRAHEDALHEVLKKQRWQKATLFFEFYGEHSFAGFHEDERHKVALLDVHVYKKGLIEPRDFLKFVAKADVDTPALLHYGNVTADIVASVKDGSLKGMTFEGVVCKGGSGRQGHVQMFKVKNQAWLDALRKRVGDDDALFERLA